MATLVSNYSSFFGNWDAVWRTAGLAGQSVVSVSASTIIIGNQSGSPAAWTQDRIEISGTGLTYDAATGVFGGTITGFRVLTPSGSNVLTASGISVAASTYGPAIKEGGLGQAHTLDQLNDLYAWDITGGALNEHLEGSDNHADVIRGGAGNDNLVAGNNPDTFQDVLIGGAGADDYELNSANDIVDERGFNDYMTNITTSASIDLRTQFLGTSETIYVFLGGEVAYGTAGNEFIRAVGDADQVIYGFGGDDDLAGWDGSDRLYGGDGNDNLDANLWTQANGADGEADYLYGGAGDDGYLIYETLDVVDESVAGSGGIDGIGTTISLDLNTATNIRGQIENLGAVGTAAINLTGNGLNNSINGNDAANVLSGIGGDDILTGNGGADRLLGGAGNDVLKAGDRFQGDDWNDTAADYMAGGAGDDDYYYSAGGDIVDESVAGSSGLDQIVSVVSIDLQDTNQVRGAVEDVRLERTHGLFAYGNSLANTLTGNELSNTLNGRAGADTMSGMAGDDRYFVDNAGDKIVEWSLNETDQVLASVSYTLTAGAQIELLTTTNASGTGSINLTGNNVDQTLQGNAGVNVLRGMSGDDKLGGGDGNDTLDGGFGADYLSGGSGSDRASYINAATAVRVHLANATVNTGEATGDTYNSIENLTGSNYGDSLTGSNGANRISGADGNDTINGLAGSDVIFAGSGNDRIYGHLGSDTLEGNAGSDTFIFHTALGASNIDTIADFSRADDTIELWNDIFTVLGAGPLAASAFKDMAVSAKDANDRIIYNSDTGILYYDADGSGTAFGNVKFAVLTGKPDITASDFVVV